MSDDEDNSKLILQELREAAYYPSQGGFSWGPSEIRDKPPSFKELGCPLSRVVGRQLICAATNLGSYGMGGYGVFGLGLAFAPDLASCSTYQAKVQEVVKHIRECTERDQEREASLEEEAKRIEEEEKRIAEEEAGGDGNGEDSQKSEGGDDGETEDGEGARCDHQSDEEDEVDPCERRDEEQWKKAAENFEWFALLTWSAADHFLLEGKPFCKQPHRFLLYDSVITDAQLTDRSSRFELKRWGLEERYAAVYDQMVKAHMVPAAPSVPEVPTPAGCANHQPNSLYSLAIDLVRKNPHLLLHDSPGDSDQHSTTVLPDSVLHDVMSKPLGRTTRVLETSSPSSSGHHLPNAQVSSWKTEESMLDAWVFTRYCLFG